MIRYTIKSPNGAARVAEADLQDALRRLAAFEDAYEELTASRAAGAAEMDRLKAAGKEKTVRYRELFAQKLMNSQTLALFERHGVRPD